MFPLSLVYGIIRACLSYVVMHVCMYEYMHVGMNVCVSLYTYVHVFMHACMHISKNIFYSHKTLTLMNINNSNTVTCKNKATQQG